MVEKVLVRLTLYFTDRMVALGKAGGMTEAYMATIPENIKWPLLTDILPPQKLGRIYYAYRAELSFPDGRIVPLKPKRRIRRRRHMQDLPRQADSPGEGEDFHGSRPGSRVFEVSQETGS